MTTIKRLSITCACLLAAVACYLVGFTPGFGIAFVLGACFETAFWVRLLNRRYKSHQRLRDLKAAEDAGQIAG